MATQDKDTKGRKFEQGTHSGTGSAAGVGPGGTGGLDKLSRQSDEPHAGAGGVMESQARGPTAPREHYGNLRAGGADTAARTPGVAPAGSQGELQTGMGGSSSMSNSSGNLQSGEEQEGETGGSMQLAREREAENEAPPSDARIGHKSDRG